MVAHWGDPHFVAAAEAWIEQTVASLGESTVAVERVHLQEWSTVWRVDTGSAPLWFKANAATYQPEADVLAAVSAANPGLAPVVVAIEPTHRWLLLRDAGTCLREESSEDAWLAGFGAVLPRYAEVQLATRDQVEALVASGVRRVDVGALPERYAALVADLGDPDLVAAADRLPGLIDRLATVPIPDLIQHDDLHDGQIFQRDGRYRLLDWADTVISHPFFSLSVCIEGVVEWGLADVRGSVDAGWLVAAYLAPFEREFGPSVRDVVPAALQLGWVVRALNGVGDEEPERLRARLTMFADRPPLV